MTEFHDKPIFLSLKHEIHRNNIQASKALFAQNRCRSEQGIGIFSDTKQYSDFIKSSLQVLEINIKHFGHPDTYQANNYAIYDDIQAWIIFLSDGGDYLFLDQFLDRYVEKPTLFLCAQSTRVKTAEKINQFVKETALFEQPENSNNKLCLQKIDKAAYSF